MASSGDDALRAILAAATAAAHALSTAAEDGGDDHMRLCADALCDLLAAANGLLALPTGDSATAIRDAIDAVLRDAKQEDRLMTEQERLDLVRVLNRASEAVAAALGAATGAGHEAVADRCMRALSAIVSAADIASTSGDGAA